MVDLMDFDPARKEAIEKIAACFKAILEKDLNMDSFEDRIRLQKIVYILKHAGLGFRYSFGWHIRGPYSPDLADDGYSYKENKEKMAFSYSFSENEKRIIAQVKTISEYLKIEENSELLASLLYLSNLLGVTDDKLKDELKLRKPRFSDEEIDKALEIWTNMSS
jgi:uncharacterized protein YwgA